MSETEKLWQALNALSDKLNDIQFRMDKYYSEKDAENKTAISMSEDAIVELAEIIGGAE